MRVTKAIREYVEEEISKKYNKVIEEHSKPYKEECNQVEEEVRKIMQKASNEAREYLQSVDFDSTRNGDSCLFSLYGWIKNDAKEKEVNEYRKEMESKRNAKIKQVLFDLEMGDTEKKQLREVLDNIVVE